MKYFFKKAIYENSGTPVCECQSVLWRRLAVQRTVQHGASGQPRDEEISEDQGCQFEKGNSNVEDRQRL